MKPTLPEPDYTGDRDFPSSDDGYAPATVQRLIDEAYAAALEDAAKECEAEADRSKEKYSYWAGIRCAENIRVLKAPPPTQRTEGGAEA